jgi:hypothetical protein
MTGRYGTRKRLHIDVMLTEIPIPWFARRVE